MYLYRKKPCVHGLAENHAKMAIFWHKKMGSEKNRRFAPKISCAGAKALKVGGGPPDPPPLLRSQISLPGGVQKSS